MSLPPLLQLVTPTAHADAAKAIAAGEHDALLVVGPAPLSQAGLCAQVAEALAALERTDASLLSDRPLVVCAPSASMPGGRLVVATTGALLSWETDARAYGFAAAAAAARAMAAGARRPLLLVAEPTGDPRFARALEVSLLAALSALWEPLEVRWTHERPSRLDALGLVVPNLASGEAAIARVTALERGRIVARDICGTEPESMAPEGMARYCEEVFAGTVVRVQVLRDQAAITAEYPLIGAVSRACLPVERHHARVIRLEYTGEGPIERTILLAGKGLTYDTGGADLKTDGHMAGMSRDKGGAAAVAGLLRVVAELRPRGVRVLGLLGAVRNSIGSNGFVADEIIRARSGVRVRIGNTDAEGRLVLADLLARLREEGEQAPDPMAFTVATLTGHAGLAYGPFTALVENGAARRRRVSEGIERAGDALGDPIERSRLRPEDYAFVAPKSAAEDVISCNSLPSSRTPRGHQFPAAFIDIVSGLRAHNHPRREAPIPFVHVDIAGATVVNGSWATGTPTGAPVIALAEGLGLLGLS